MSDEAIPAEGSQDVAMEAPAAVGFLDTLNEENRGNPSLQKFKDVNNLAKSYTHLERMVGADNMARPAENWSDDQWGEFYNASGRPEAPTNYEISLEGKLGDSTLEAFRESAHEAGLNNKQAQTIASFMDGSLEQMEVERYDHAETLLQEGVAELKQEYGQAFEQQLQLANGAARQLLGNKTEILNEIELADGRLLGDHPDIIRMFSAFAKEIGEDKIVGEPTELVMTADEAGRKIPEIMASGPYKDHRHPEHLTYVAEASRLFRIQSGEAGQA